MMDEERAAFVGLGSLSEGHTIESDGDLVERHRYGDRQAFEEIYCRFSGLVYNLALRLCGNGDVAQDLTQDVFLRVFRSLGRFAGRSSLKTWIYRICLNHCRTQLGRRRIPAQSLTDPKGGDVELEAAERDPEALAMAAEAERDLGQALPRLEAVFGEAVALRDLEGLSYKEIAEVLGVRMGTVRSRIARGREQLRRLMEETTR